MKHAAPVLLALCLGAADILDAQSTGVPLYPAEERNEPQLAARAEKLRQTGALFSETQVREQLKRDRCTLALPVPLTKPLSGRQIWSVAHRSHLRVGWNFHCTKCTKWHFNLAGGYPITKDGAVVTCYHVVKPPADFKEGGLVVVDEAGNFLPVTEILAASEPLDVCILRVAADNLPALPLNTDVAPGDKAYCFSDPLHQRGYFSAGIVNRFLSRNKTAGSNVTVQTRLNVTTDWAPGSSGSAVVDECGNVIGHVSSISTLGRRPTAARDGQTAKSTGESALITLHEAVSARDVKALIRGQ